MAFGAPVTRNPASRFTCCLTRSGLGMPFRTTDSGCSPRSAISREPRSNHPFSNEENLCVAFRGNDHTLESLMVELRRAIPADVEAHACKQANRHEGMQFCVVVLKHQSGLLPGMEGHHGWFELPGADLHQDP